MSANWWEMEAEENGFCGVASRFHFYPDEGGSAIEFTVEFNIFAQSPSAICLSHYPESSTMSTD